MLEWDAGQRHSELSGFVSMALELKSKSFAGLDDFDDDN